MRTVRLSIHVPEVIYYFRLSVVFEITFLKISTISSARSAVGKKHI